MLFREWAGICGFSPGFTGEIYFLQLVFASALTDAGGSVNFALGAAGTTESIEALSFPITVLAGPRDLISGSITAPVVTPLPAALPLLATGLGALRLLGWRRKRKAAA